MNELAMELRTFPQVKNVVLIVGEKINAWCVKEFLLGTRLERLDIFASTTYKRAEFRKILRLLKETEECNVPSEVQIMGLDKIPSFQEPDDQYLLIFDSLDKIETILEPDRFHPTYLLGAMERQAVTAFDVWERYRSVCEKIYILSLGNNRETEALNWTQNSESATELSVIFPMYNVAAYLRECVESVKAWKADYVEYLFVDDGSPDNCAEIIEEYHKTDPRIKLLRKKNGGCASARQFGLEHAKGRYIGFIDPDDYIDPTMYRKLLSRAMTGSYEIAYCGYKELYESTGGTREVEDLIGWPYANGTTDPDALSNLTAYLRIAIWRGIYSADLIRRNHIHFYTDLRRFDDLPFKFEVHSCAKSVVSVPEYLYYYRLARPGQDVSADDERLYVHFPIFNYLDDFVNEKFNHKMTEKLQVCKLHTHIYALKKIKPEFEKEYMTKAREDLLSNYTRREMKWVYAGKISKRDQLYLKAILAVNTRGLRWLKRRKI